ncbi:hypothetical protein MTR67_053684 [Solanum verrucosum]|uniref:Myb-like domain-containing protein n=1 Tax=Solanum verrucosum TaxID=315347 RepID=A0AAF0VAE2_SOLVR|nr:hypothetical protein MTR67_053684 [Solanum verrucosum]
MNNNLERRICMLILRNITIISIRLKRKRGRKGIKQINEGESRSGVINKIGTRKNCAKWTVDLHSKFTRAVEQLGQGKCYPADIVEVMNVPGLTRKQVSSHLQKCRENKWRPRKERKNIHHGSSSDSQQRSSCNTSLERKKRSCTKLGKMPRLQTNIPNQIQRVSEFPPINTNNIFAISTQQQLHNPQLQAQPHYLNPSLSAQNDVGGQLQQHSLLFGMSGSIIGSTNYRSSLAFNSGDHHDYGLDNHTQNGYGLDLNPTHVTTHSGSTMITNTNVGNVTLNGLGATNANFQQDIGEQNMFDPSNIVANDTEGSDPNEWKYWDAFVDYDHVLFGKYI